MAADQELTGPEQNINEARQEILDIIESFRAGGEWSQGIALIEWLTSDEFYRKLLAQMGIDLRMTRNFSQAEVVFNDLYLRALRAGDKVHQLEAQIGEADLARVAERDPNYYPDRDKDTNLQIAQAHQTLAEVLIDDILKDDELREETEAVLVVAKAWDQFGLLARERGDLYQAKNYYDQALKNLTELAERKPENNRMLDRLARTHEILGVVELDLGNEEAALVNKQEALSIYDGLSDVQGVANSAFTIAQIYEAKKDDPAFYLLAADSYWNRLVDVLNRMETPNPEMVAQLPDNFKALVTNSNPE